jgi:hypothetical protein
VKPDELIAIMWRASVASLPEGAWAVPGGDLAAVFVPRARGLPATRRGAVRLAADRQAWLERLMPLGTVLPVLPRQPVTRADAAAMMDANAELARRELRRLEGLVQYQITLTFDADAACTHFLETDAGFGRAVTVETVAPALGARLHDALSAVATEIRELPRADTLAANFVVLVRHDDLPRLEEAVARIDALWPDGLRFRLVGPSPALSFASVALRRAGRGELAAARTLLDLDAGADARAVATARARALRELRDVPPEAIRDAAEILRCAGLVDARHGPVHSARLWSEGMAAAAGDFPGRVG